MRYIFILILLAGCTKNSPPPKEDLVVAVSSSPDTLDPRFATGALTQRLNQLIYQSFVRIGPDLEIKGDAARDWRMAGNIYEFSLKPNLMFANGRKVTGGDIEYSLRQFQRPDSPFSSSFSKIRKVECSEPSGGVVCEFFLESYDAKMLTTDWPIFKILPSHEIAKNEQIFFKKPFGSGPYQWSSQDANKITLARSPFYDPIASSPNLVFKVIRDDFTRFLKTYRGDIDLVLSEMPLQKISSFRARPNQFEVQSLPGLSFSYLLINHNHSALSQLSLRKALAQSINRNEVVEFVLDGLASIAQSILTPGNPYFWSSDLAFKFDLKSAQEKIRDLNLQGTTLNLLTSNNNYAIKVGKVIALQLNKAGLRVKHQSFEWGAYYSFIKKGQFELATMRWVGAVDPDIYRIALHSKEVPPGRNRGYYENKRLDQLLEQGVIERDKDQRIKIYTEVQKMVIDQLPIIPLWYNQQVNIINKRVVGFVPTLTGDYTPLVRAYKK